MQQQETQPPIYRATVLGNALQDIIDQMVSQGELQEHHKDLILSKFDRAVLEQFCVLEKPMKAIKVTGQDTIYNFVEECHKFKTKQFEMKGDDGF